MHTSRLALVLVLVTAFGLSACGRNVAIPAAPSSEDRAVLSEPMLFPLPAATPNFIVNGSFEAPVVASRGYDLFRTGQSFAGWKVVGAPGNVAIVKGDFTQNGLAFPAGCGTQWLDLTGNSNTATGVSQTVHTVPNKTYTLRFLVGNIYDPGGLFGTISTVHVFVNGHLTMVARNSAGRGAKKLVWQAFNLLVTAHSTATSVAFLNADPSNDNSNGLDCVSLT